MSREHWKVGRSNAIRFLLWRDVLRLDLHVTIEEAAETIGYDVRAVRSVIGKAGMTDRFRKPEGDSFTDGRKRANLHEFVDVIGGRSAGHGPTE